MLYTKTTFSTIVRHTHDILDVLEATPQQHYMMENNKFADMDNYINERLGRRHYIESRTDILLEQVAFPEYNVDSVE